MLKVTRHEVVKNDVGKLIRLIIGVNYIDAITNKTAYREVILTPKDFTGTPANLDILAKAKERLKEIPTFESMLPDGTTVITQGKSILQIMKDEAGGDKETSVSLKKGEAGSLIDEALKEV